MAEDTKSKTFCEEPPAKLWKHDLADILQWYEYNLCSQELIDPRGYRILFAPERFPHLIKLLKPGSEKEITEPQKHTNAIRCGNKCNADYGGYHAERAQTLTWIPAIILRPTMILEVTEKTIWEKPGDTVYVKEFDKKGYRHKLLVCRTLKHQRLAVVTSHPRDYFKIGKGYKIVWPETAKAAE